MPARCGGVLMARDRKAFRESQMKRQAEIERAEKEIERLEGQHDDEPDDRKRRTVCYCVPLPLNGCCFFSLRDCVLLSGTISVILNSIFLLMAILDFFGWYEGGRSGSPFDTDPILKNTELVHYTFTVDSFLQVFAALILIIGVTKESSRLQLPYLVIIVLCNIATMIVVLIDVNHISQEVVAQRFIMFFAHFYMWIHALSYYFLTKEHEERTGMLDR